MPVVPFIPLIAAGVGAAGTIAATNSANKGQKQAAQASQQASDQATAEQRRQYDLSRQDQAPWLATGTSALNTLAGMYGLNSTPSPSQSGGSYFDEAGYLAANPDVLASIRGGGFGGSALNHWNEYGQFENRTGGYQTPTGQLSTGQVGSAVQVPEGANPDQAPFFASPDYQFRLNEQGRALTARNSALGIQDSGAAQKAALQYSGNLASGEFNNYANRLSALAGVGQSAANTNAQLGQNYAGAVGNIGMNNAQNLASSYQSRANATGNMWSSLGGIGAGLLNNYAR